MIAASVIAVLSVLLGAAVGFSRRFGDRHLGPVRTFAFAAAVAVVFGQFLPDALEGIGAWAALPFVIGVGAPWLLERVTSRVSRSERALGLEVGYLGLLVHQLGDGVGMGTYTGPRHEGHSHTDVFLAIGGHTVPVAAMVVVAFLRAKGPKAAAVRALGLALAVVLGVVAARHLGMSIVERNHAAISALVGGLLLHIATHDLRSNLPTTPRERALDLSGGAVGLLVVLGTSGGHEHEHVEAAIARPEALSAFLPIALLVAPPLLLGLVVSSVVQAVGQRALFADGSGLTRLLTRRSAAREALTGSILALTLPSCACGTLPVASSLRARRAAPALVGAFLLATPSVGADTLLVTATLFGLGAAFSRAALAIVVAIVGALVLAIFARRPEAESEAQEGARDLVGEAAALGEPVGTRAARALDELVHHTLPWTLVGLVVASYADSAIGFGALAGWSGHGLDVLVVVAIALPGYVCATSATPLAAVLLARGLSPAAVIAGLLVGPALNAATLGWLSRAYGRRAALGLAAAVLGGSIAAAFVASSSGAARLVRPVDVTGGPLGAWVALALLLVLGIGAAYRRGVRGFFASLLDPVDPSSGDGHDHGHVHDHDATCAHDHDHTGIDARVELSAHGH